MMQPLCNDAFVKTNSRLGRKEIMANDKELEIKIQSSRGTKDFSFPKTIKVLEVIAQAVQAFEFAPGDSFALMLATNPEEALDPNRPLVSYHVKDGDILILTATGSGV
jgi:hypothetical protein